MAVQGEGGRGESRGGDDEDHGGGEDEEEEKSVSIKV